MKLNGGVEIDLQRSFYVGDAAGRHATGSRPADFSDSDKEFAEALGLTFYTPELMFLEESEPMEQDPSIHPAKDQVDAFMIQENVATELSNAQEQEKQTIEPESE